mgnify:CR=1 FL=1
MDLDIKLKKLSLSIGMFSFLFSLTMIGLFSIMFYFYIKESISTIKAQEEHLLSCYANRITNDEHSIDEFKELTFGTLESFTTQVAIFDMNNKLLYSTFKNTPVYNLDKKTYFKDKMVFYNSTKYFSGVGTAKVIFKKNLDFSSVKEKVIIVIFACLLFLVMCSFFLYFHIKGIYSNITKKLDIFFKDAVHEIRTPLGVLQINLDFLDNTMDESKPLKRAQAGLRNLTSVYESLEFCIKDKKVNYKKETIEMSKFLEKRVDFFRVLAEIKNIEILNEIEKDIYIDISRTELQRLIDNNISNAIKYSKKHTKIEIKLYVKDQSIILLFSNYGEHIKDTNEIFKRYYRGDDIRGGFGLGLSIVNYICDVYKIDIKVDSKENGHSIFMYKIPQKIARKDEK